MTRLEHDWYPEPLPPNVELGEGSWLYSAFAFLHFRSRRPRAVLVGRHSGIYNGTFFDLGLEGEVIIGDYCTLVGAIISTNGRVTIGDYAFVAHEVVIADSAVASPPFGDSVSAPSPVAGDTPPEIVIGSNVWIGARAVLLSGAHIGANAIVGAAAVVRSGVPANAIVVGNPAKVFARISE
jgi:acetyltransferase-like isoleucine patch superfamily enzyme